MALSIWMFSGYGVFIREPSTNQRKHPDPKLISPIDMTFMELTVDVYPR